MTGDRRNPHSLATTEHLTRLADHQPSLALRGAPRVPPSIRRPVNRVCSVDKIRDSTKSWHSIMKRVWELDAATSSVRSLISAPSQSIRTRLPGVNLTKSAGRHVPAVTTASVIYGRQLSGEPLRLWSDVVSDHVSALAAQRHTHGVV